MLCFCMISKLKHVSQNEHLVLLPSHLTESPNRHFHAGWICIIGIQDNQIASLFDQLRAHICWLVVHDCLGGFFHWHSKKLPDSQRGCNISKVVSSDQTTQLLTFYTLHRILYKWIGFDKSH